jgi:hypothetical protein
MSWSSIHRYPITHLEVAKLPKSFSTIKRPLSLEEKRQRAIEYNRYKAPFEPVVNVEEFAKHEIFDEIIILKCLHCGFQEEVDYEFIEESWDPYDSDYPIAYCAKCNQPEVVPLDIYLKLIKQ